MSDPEAQTAKPKHLLNCQIPESGRIGRPRKTCSKTYVSCWAEQLRRGGAGSNKNPSGPLPDSASNTRIWPTGIVKSVLQGASLGFLSSCGLAAAAVEEVAGEAEAVAGKEELVEGLRVTPNTQP